MTYSIDIIPALSDNYIYIVSDSELGLAMVVDPADAKPVLKVLKERDLHLALILNTHHHKDHTGGNDKLQAEYGAPIIGPTAEQDKIGFLSRGVGQGDFVTFSTLRGRVIATPGHTKGHIAFHFPQLSALFCGDTLFSLGCGKLFEGTPAQMWQSLSALRELPDETLVYCGHEYTEANARFALAIDKNNPDLKARAEQAALLRRQGKPTLPALLGVEKKANPFLRIDDREFHKVLAKGGLIADGADPAALFASMRSAKDHFGT